MTRKKGRPAPAASPADKASAALSADPGPLLLTIGINRVTGTMGMAGNAASEHDFELAREALAAASAQVHQQLLAIAEARGAAKAKEKPP